MAYEASVRAAVAYLSQRILDDAWVQEHDDVAFYFKAPMAFLEAGARQQAEKALALAARYVERGGAGSKNGAYDAMFPHYPWMWMCYAAVGLQEQELAERCRAKLLRYLVPATGAGLVIAEYPGDAAPCEADFFATAELVKVAVLLADLPAAEASADMLLRVVEANRVHMAGGRFYLRWEGMQREEGRLELFVKESAFNCIDQKLTGQLYFLVAFPAMVLLELSKATQDARRAAAYASAAQELLSFLKGCAGVFESTWSHKLARAAAMAGDLETARKIADFFVSKQQELGCFQADPDGMDSLDQTAEIAVWLSQIGKEFSAVSPSLGEAAAVKAV